VSKLSFINKVALNRIVVLNVPLIALYIKDREVLLLRRITQIVIQGI
jgi:hypothetical protein